MTATSAPPAPPWPRLVLALLLALPAAAAEGPVERSGGAELAVSFALVQNQHRGEEFLAELTLANRGAEPLGGSGWALYFNFGRPVRAAGAAPQVSLERVNGDLWRLLPSDRFAPLAPGEARRLPLLGGGAVTRYSEAPAGPYLAFADGRAEPVADYRVEPFRDPQRLRRAAGDRLPVATPGVLFERQRQLHLLPAEALVPLVPTPARLEVGIGHVELDPTWTIYHPRSLAREAALLAGALEAELGLRLPTLAEAPAGRRSIVLALAPSAASGSADLVAGPEAYRLTVDDAPSVTILASHPSGIFYGCQTLRALLAPSLVFSGRAILRWVTVEDAPRFPYRGLHLDVSRNFHSRRTVEKLLDLAAFYKLNRFHFHLTDDEGWRLPVAALPELTEVGGRRGHTLDESDRLVPSFGSGPDPAASRGSGHYSRDELVAILRHAGERHIRVIPEIDVPGHARAAIRAMAARHARLTAAGRDEEARAFLLAHPEDRSEYRSVQGWDDNVIDVCMPSTYRFLETVFDEIAGIWAEAGAPLEEIHVGGDEVPAGVWRGSPACRELIAADPELEGFDDLPSYFLRRVGDLLAARGLATAGWEEIALAEAPGGAKRPNPEFVARDFRPWVWNNVWGWGGEELGYRLANAGYRVVLANATNLYFDLAYDNHPEEPGYAWAGFVDTRKPWELLPLNLYESARLDLMGNPIDPAAYADRARLTAAGRSRVRGIQGQLWAESSKSPAILEYQAFPKLLGLAERAWAAEPGWARIDDRAERRRQEAIAWNEFANRLGRRELPRLDRLHGGVLYRLPPPGAVVRDGRLEANVAFPGLPIRYTTDGTEPTVASPLYAGPVAVTGEVRLRTFDSRGRGSRTVTVGGASRRSAP